MSEIPAITDYWQLPYVAIKIHMWVGYVSPRVQTSVERAVDVSILKLQIDICRFIQRTFLLKTQYKISRSIEKSVVKYMYSLLS